MPLLVLVDTIRAPSLAALSKSFEESIAIVQKSRPMIKSPQGPGSPEGKQTTCARWLSAYGISRYCTLFALLLHVPASWPILLFAAACYLLMVLFPFYYRGENAGQASIHGSSESMTPMMNPGQRLGLVPSHCSTLGHVMTTGVFAPNKGTRHTRHWTERRGKQRQSTGYTSEIKTWARNSGARQQASTGKTYVCEDSFCH
jgi:hypothetical protein